MDFFERKYCAGFPLRILSKLLHPIFIHKQPYLLLILFTASNLQKVVSTPINCPGITSFEKLTRVIPNPDTFTRSRMLYNEPEAITAECVKACKELPTCAGFLIDYNSSSCVSYDDLPDLEIQLEDDFLPTHEAVNFFQKVCFPSVQDKFCGSAFWSIEKVSSAFFEGFVNMDIQVKTRMECAISCLTESSFICRSASYDQTSKRCFLSTESRRTQPQAFRHQSSHINTTATWIYMENDCVPNAFEMSCGFKRRKDKAVSSMDAMTYAKSLHECEKDCQTESKFSCRSYSFKDLKCKLSSDDRISLGFINEVIDEDDSAYGELVCSRDDCVNGRYFYERMIGYSLSSAEEEDMRDVVSRTSMTPFFSDCVNSCSQLGLLCRVAVMDHSRSSCFKLDRNSQGRSNELITVPEKIFLEKTCLMLPYKDENCQGQMIFQRIPGYEFESTAYLKTYSGTTSRQECEQKCLIHNALIRNKRQTLSDYNQDDKNQQNPDDAELEKLSSPADSISMREQSSKQKGDLRYNDTSKEERAGGPFLCKSVTYNEATTECRLTNQSFLFHRLVPSVHGLKSSHLENLCLFSDNRKRRNDDGSLSGDEIPCFFEKTPSMTVVFVETSFNNVPTVHECMKNCLESPVCFSFSYSEDNQKCLLSRESHRLPEVAVMKPSDSYHYYEMNCISKKVEGDESMTEITGTAATTSSPTTALPPVTPTTDALTMSNEIMTTTTAIPENVTENIREPTSYVDSTSSSTQLATEVVEEANTTLSMTSISVTTGSTDPLQTFSSQTPATTSSETDKITTSTSPTTFNTPESPTSDDLVSTRETESEGSTPTSTRTESVTIATTHVTSSTTTKSTAPSVTTIEITLDTKESTSLVPPTTVDISIETTTGSSFFSSVTQEATNATTLPTAG